MSPDHALAELRLATREEHARIEALLRLDEAMPLARYARIMRGFDTFLQAWEPRIEAALPPRLREWYRPRRRGTFARADVDWLRAHADLDPPATSGEPARALALEGLPAVLGSLYVLEGSALGAQVIAPRLEAGLGLRAGCGASYFNAFADEAGAMWRDFRALAARELGASPEAVAQACGSARGTFVALAEVFAPSA